MIVIISVNEVKCEYKTIKLLSDWSLTSIARVVLIIATLLVSAAGPTAVVRIVVRIYAGAV